MDDDETKDGQDGPDVKRSPMLRNASLAVLAIVAVGTFATLFATFTGGISANIDATLDLAAQEYSHEDWRIVKGLCDKLTPTPDWEDSQRQLHAFLSAAASAHMAMTEEEPVERRRRAAQAVNELRDAQKLSFPELYKQDGMLLLGQAAYASGDFTAAAEAFPQGLGNEIDDQRRYYRQLADSQFRSVDISSAKALDTIDKFLALATISPEERADANLLKAKILSSRNRWDQAIQASELAEQVASFAVEAKMARARIKLDHAKSIINNSRLAPTDSHVPPEARKLIADTLVDMNEISRTSSDDIKMRATLAAGDANFMLGNHVKALGLFGIARQYHTDIGVSAVGAIGELEVLSLDGPINECMATVSFLSNAFSSLDAYDPRLMSLEEFRIRLTTVIENIQRRGKYQDAIVMSRKLVPIFNVADARRLEAASYALWANETQANGVRTDGSIDPQANLESQRQHTAAGKAYAEAAQQRYATADYPSFLWDAIVQFNQAHQFERCLDLLDPYLRYEVRDQMPRGLIMQANAMVALGNFDNAILVCETCIAEFPRDSLSYEARLVAAQAARQLGKYDVSRAYLDANLHDGLLSPDSQPWRNSLLALGELMYSNALETHLVLITPNPRLGTVDLEDQIPLFRKNQIVFDEAIESLEEAVLRYPKMPETRRAIYLAAQAHQYAAYWPRMEAKLPETIDSKRRQLMNIHRQHLIDAAKAYQDLRTEMNMARDVATLSEQEQIMLRNCYLGEADALFALNRWEPAIEAYLATVNRFINEPIALEALVQQSRCFEALGRKEDVNRILLQAKQILDRIPSEYDDRFATTTRFNRTGWTQFLNWMLRT